MKYLQRHIGFIVVLLLSYASIQALFIPGFFPIHDDTQVARVFTMTKALQDGFFPVRYVSDLGYGYGYPIFNFYAPLAYYVGGILNSLGFDSLFATKAMMIIGILFSGIAMYIFAKEWWGDVGGIIAAVFYVYAPYHALDIYVRGDVAEFWAYAFIPIAFYGVLKLSTSKNWKYLLIGSLGFSGTLLSHNLTALMVAPFLLAFSIFFSIRAMSRKETLAYIFLLPFIFGIGIASFYWIPVLFEMRYTNVLSQIGGGADFRDHFVCLQQLWQSPWGFGGSAPGCIDGISLKIGKLHIFSVFAGLLSVFFIGRKKQASIISIFSIIGFIVATFLTLSISSVLWEMTPLMHFFQFPWRFLILSTFFSSFLAGSWVLLFDLCVKKWKFPSWVSMFATAFFLTIAAIIYFPLFQPQTILGKTNSDYTSEEAIKWTASKISDEYMPKNFKKPANVGEIPEQRLQVVHGDAVISTVKESTTHSTYNVQLIEDSTFRANIAYFPAFHIYAFDKEIPYKPTNQGLLFDLKLGKDWFGNPGGAYTLDIIFKQTFIEKIANSISLISISLLIVGIIYERKKKDR